ncbi:MAG: hypothetical protein HRU12_23010 [Phaeodactylibacter sp.]|nr:hypothetical protein [Phaeodactylibacter sp.]
MFRLVSLVFCLLITLSVNASISPEDSLLVELKQTDSEEVKIQLLSALCERYSLTGADSTTAYCERAIALAQSNGNAEAWVVNSIDLARWYHKKSQYNLALPIYYAAINRSEKEGLKSLKASTYNNLALTHQRMSQPDSAYFYWNKSEITFLEADNPTDLWKVYLGMFNLFNEKQDTAQTNLYAAKAYEFIHKSSSRSDLGFLLFQLMQYYFQTSQFDQYAQFQQHWDDYRRSQKPDETLMQQPEHIALYMYAAEEQAKVEVQLMNAIDYFEQSGIPFRAGWCYEDLAKLRYERGDKMAGLEAMLQALRYYQQAQVPYRRGRALNALYQWNKEIGEANVALQYLENYKSLEDSLSNITVAKNLNALRVKAETAQKEQALQIKDLELIQKTQERNILLVAALLLGALALAVFIGFRQRLTANRRMAKQEQALQEQRIRQLEQEGRLSALQSMIQGQEQERSRIANDLHDSLGGIITASHKYVTEMARLIPDNNQSLAERAVSIIGHAGTELRRIAQNLMPRSLTLLGLEGALEDLSVQLNNQGLNCQFQAIGLDRKLPEEMAVTLFRIVQELTNNIVKHAKAQHVLIQLLQRDQMLFLTVEDDGQGFDLEKARQKASLGMGSIASRVDYLKGELDIDTAIGQGTTFNIQVPC